MAETDDNNNTVTGSVEIVGTHPHDCACSACEAQREAEQDEDSLQAFLD